MGIGTKLVGKIKADEGRGPAKGARTGYNDQEVEESRTIEGGDQRRGRRGGRKCTIMQGTRLVAHDMRYLFVPLMFLGMFSRIGSNESTGPFFLTAYTGSSKMWLLTWSEDDG